MSARVHLARTGQTLRGVPSTSLIAACERSPEGKALAVFEPKLRVKEGGVWYPVEPSWGYGKAAKIVFIEAVAS